MSIIPCIQYFLSSRSHSVSILLFILYTKYFFFFFIHTVLVFYFCVDTLLWLSLLLLSYWCCHVFAGEAYSCISSAMCCIVEYVVYGSCLYKAKKKVQGNLLLPYTYIHTYLYTLLLFCFLIFLVRFFSFYPFTTSKYFHRHGLFSVGSISNRLSKSCTDQPSVLNFTGLSSSHFSIIAHKSG